MDKQLNNSQASPNKTLSVLSEGLADERDSLYNIETYLDRPTKYEPCQKVQLTEEQKKNLTAQVQKVRTQLEKLDSKLNFCKTCPEIKELKAEVLKSYNYLLAIEASVNSGCLKKPYELPKQQAVGLVNLAKSIYKDNLKATNWNYGSMTTWDFKKMVFKSTTQYNQTSCPLATPYVSSDGKSCMQCLGTFMLDTRTCKPCPSD